MLFRDREKCFPLLNGMKYVFGRYQRATTLDCRNYYDDLKDGFDLPWHAREILIIMTVLFSNNKSKFIIVGYLNDYFKII